MWYILQINNITKNNLIQQKNSWMCSWSYALTIYTCALKKDKVTDVLDWRGDFKLLFCKINIGT